MQKREINPTEWLQAFNINHAIEVTGGERVLYLSGQTANAADGTAHPGDLVAQFRLAWSNLKDALAAAGMDPTNIVRLNMYTTDVDGFMAAAGELVPIFAQDGCKLVSTLLGVTRSDHLAEIRQGRSDQDSSPCPTQPQSHAQTPAASRHMHRLPRWLGAGSSSRKRGRRRCRST